MKFQRRLCISVADPLLNAELVKRLGNHGIMQYAGAVMIFMRPAGAVMIFTPSRNAATGDNSLLLHDSRLSVW